MTIGEIIKKRVDAMPPSRQRKVLSLVRKLGGASPANRMHHANATPISHDEETYVPKDPALLAIAGMWKDRKDLPKDPVAAVKVIRARMRSRGRRNA